MTSIAREVHNHLLHSRNSVRRTKVMNRQARGGYGDDVWNDHGSVSLKEAALAEAIVWFERGASVGVNDFRPVTIEVRDEAFPENIYRVSVEREVNYRVRGLRGGE